MQSVLIARKPMFVSNNIHVTSDMEYLLGGDWHRKAARLQQRRWRIIAATKKGARHAKISATFNQ